jgi:CHAD domain-containing protein
MDRAWVRSWQWEGMAIHNAALQNAATRVTNRMQEFDDNRTLRARTQSGAELLICNKSVSYHLRPGERVPAEVKRIVREEIESAVRQLSGKGEADRDEAIHEARKNVKKIRGVLRLMRPELDEIYGRENPFFRDVGLRLSQFRDAGAMLETFDALREKYRGELGRGRMASIRRGLMARKQQAEKQGGIEKVLTGMATVLRRSAKRVENWPLAADGFGAIAPGLEATFRRGQKALAGARKHPLPENYHEWRKRVKDHWYHVRLLEGVWDGTMPAYERRLKDLETWLGEDHNLVVLQEKVMAEPGSYGREPEIALFVRLIGKYHKELRGDALALGARIYGRKPRQFSKEMRRMWDAGQTQRAAASPKKNGRRGRPSLRQSKMSEPPVTAGSGNRGGPTGSHAEPRRGPR